MWLLNDDIKVALKDINEVFRIMSFVFLIPILVSVFYYSGQNFSFLLWRISAFLIPSLVSYLLYLILRGIKSENTAKLKHTLIAVSIAWFVISVIGTLPYLISNDLNLLDSFFESMSGWTTTGLTMISDIKNTERDILFYRSLTQWVGGIGIVALALLVLMKTGNVGVKYYSSERGDQRIKPSVKSTIKEIWKIYAIYTFLCFSLLYIFGMNAFDAINHSLTTLATGGFSTYNDSISYFKNPVIEVILIIFMIIGAISFLIHFRIFQGDYKSLLRNIEFKYMIAILFIAVLIIFFSLYFYYFYSQKSVNTLNLFRESSFQVVSAITSSGFSIADTSKWFDLQNTILMLLMYIGGFYGSTAGGIKLLRFIVIMKVINFNLRKLILPKTAIIRMRIGKESLSGDEILHTFGVCAIYLIITIIGSIVIMGFTDYSLSESLFISFSSMGNVGLISIANDSWFSIGLIPKITIIILMWVGRLEIFPVLILMRSLFFRRRFY